MPALSLKINLRKLEENIRLEQQLFAKHGIELMGVNKVFNGCEQTALALINSGVKIIAEAKLSNLKKLSHLPCEKCLLRSPAISEIGDVIRYADISLNSDASIVTALSKEAERQGRMHRVLLLIDMGDLREGVWFEDWASLVHLVSTARNAPWIDLEGIATNFSCYAGTKPSIDNLGHFIDLAASLEKACDLKFRVLSGGNCTSYHLVHKGHSMAPINQLRSGALHQFGIEYVDMHYLEGFHHSTKPVERATSPLFQLQAEIIELNRKPTLPRGETGIDAFMQKKTFCDRGVRQRALVSFGRVDVPHENCLPVDNRIQILGQTSDHTILDVDDMPAGTLAIGNHIGFELDYTGLLMAASAPDTHMSFCHD